MDYNLLHYDTREIYRLEIHMSVVNIKWILYIYATVTERRKLLAAVSVGVLAVFIVLPLWWKTTEVYRAALPYNEIERLSTHKVRIRMQQPGQ